VVLHHLFAARTPLRNRVLGCHFGTGLGRRNYYRVCRLKRIQSTTLGPKLLRNRVLGSFAPFGCRKCTVPKSDPRMPFWHEFELTKLLSSFLAKTHPIHYIRSKTHILGGFAPFGCQKCTYVKSGPRMPFWHEFGSTKLLSSFSAKTHPIHYFWSQTHVLGGFAPFVCRKSIVAKSGPRMPFWHEFGPMKLLSSFSPKMHQIH